MVGNLLDKIAYMILGSRWSMCKSALCFDYMAFSGAQAESS